MKIALVHDWLVSVAGGEKVLEAICELYDGPIFTLFVDEKSIQSTPFEERTIHTSFLQKFPKFPSYYRNLLPLFPAAIEKLDLSGFDLILSSSHAVAKGIKKRRDQLHICYCHTPMRYAWDLSEFHLDQLHPLKQIAARPMLKYLRHWDYKTHDRVDHFIANSSCVAKRIESHYGRSAAVIYPPVDTHLFTLAPKKENYFVTASRLVPYKRVDLLIKAFAKLPDKELRIIGTGPELKKLKSKAPQNVHFLGHLPAPTLRDTVSKAKAFLFAAEEDFGIVTVEAQSAGVPVIAFGRGGSLETVLPASTGMFFKEQTPEAIREAVQRFDKMADDFEPAKIQRHAEQFSKDRFQAQFKSFVDNCLE